MTWYYVALWPGVGYTLDETVVDTFSEAQAIAIAALSGCGESLSVDGYEEYLDFIGVPENERETYEDDDFVYLDEEGFIGYVNIRHAIVREAGPEDMLKLDEISFNIRIPGSAEWTRMVFDSGKEFRSAVYSMDQSWWNSELYRVAINGYNYPFSGTLEELIDELQLSDADQIASRNVKSKAKTKTVAKKTASKAVAKKATTKAAAKKPATKTGSFKFTCPNCGKTLTSKQYDDEYVQTDDECAFNCGCGAWVQYEKKRGKWAVVTNTYRYADEEVRSKLNDRPLKEREYRLYGRGGGYTDLSYKQLSSFEDLEELEIGDWYGHDFYLIRSKNAKSGTKTVRSLAKKVSAKKPITKKTARRKA